MFYCTVESIHGTHLQYRHTAIPLLSDREAKRVRTDSSCLDGTPDGKGCMALPGLKEDSSRSKGLGLWMSFRVA